MNAKRTALFLPLVLSALSVFAHDKGDLMLNIEPMFGFGASDVEIQSNGKRLIEQLPGYSASTLEGQYALGLTLHYYFLDFIGVNTGLLVNAHLYQITFSDKADSGAKEDLKAFFGSVFLTVPLGFRLSVSAFAAGAGLTLNIPLSVKARLSYYEGSNAKAAEWEDKTFSLPAFAGWYADAGFDLSGRKGRRGGFGMLVRFAGSFSDRLAGTKAEHPYFGNLSYKPFGYFNIGLIFQAAMELGNFPLN